MDDSRDSERERRFRWKEKGYFNGREVKGEEVAFKG